MAFGLYGHAIRMWQRVLVLVWAEKEAKQPRFSLTAHIGQAKSELALQARLLRLARKVRRGDAGQ